MEDENCNVNWNIEKNRAYKQVDTKRWKALLCEAKAKKKKIYCCTNSASHSLPEGQDGL